MDVLCKIPPLCFKLNARPPKGFLYYFAYGPNMSRDRLCTYLQCEIPPLKFWAVLFGFGLVFNKKGTGNDAATVGGFPNLEYNAASSVEGCIFQLTPVQLERLDAFMDYPKIDGSTEEHIPVMLHSYALLYLYHTQ
ncbi:AIG2 family protein [Elysia marginata]|uniref:AIG2 family protein n=1 Tax=Elysia marginata TaxID=1093978 RepID=A0AAV4G3Y3_9GAST|nr:AIG2 family protein [Elysia marginata]